MITTEEGRDTLGGTEGAEEGTTDEITRAIEIRFIDGRGIDYRRTTEIITAEIIIKLEEREADNERLHVNIEDVVDWNDYKEEWRWVNVGQSVYGVAIQLLMNPDCLKSSNSTSSTTELRDRGSHRMEQSKQNTDSIEINYEYERVMNIIVPVFLVGGVQGIIIYRLWKSLPAIGEPMGDSGLGLDFCEYATDQGMDLFLVCAIAVFLYHLIPS